jgi:hypothetical protein
LFDQDYVVKKSVMKKKTQAALFYDVCIMIGHGWEKEIDR